MKKPKIDKNTNIQELIATDPEMNEVLYKYGLYCGNCFAAGYDTVEEGARTHGLQDEEIEELLEELNKKTKLKNTQKQHS
ncbi:MAG TPA: DUF1858 domain-containing protein [Candidatus Woesebacteria bacterium]|nr:DUF1858 domain-containing protein [Candidatus Woesebacteria bacterium]